VMARKSVPKDARSEVMGEFNHRCAICEADKPQIHHIDGNPANNEVSNLVPLCPNCHLIDQHNPTVPIDPRKLHLFREFKDPTILSPQFEPLFQRARFILDLNVGSFSLKEARQNAKDLVSFVSELEKGTYYRKKLVGLLGYVGVARSYGAHTPSSDVEGWTQEDTKRYYDKLSKGRQNAIELIIELLKYQQWPSQGKRGKS
jgi:hypothetical protein